MTQLRWQTHLGFTIESTGWGVAAPAPTTFVPITKCEFKDVPKFYYDEAYRGIQAKDFGAYLTTLEGEFDFDTDVYVDTLPFLLGVGMLGDNDAVTTVNTSVLSLNYTTGSVSAHTFLLGTPKSITFFEWNGFSERAYQGGRLEEAQFKYAADGRCEMSYKGKSRLSVLVNSANPILGGFAPILGWQANVFLNGVQTTRVIDSELTFKRGLEVLFTQAQTQSPTNIYAFPMECDGKLTVDFVDETEYNFMRTNNQSATFQLTFAASSQNGLQFFVPQPIWTSAVVDKGKEYLTVKLDFKTVYNAANSTNVKMIVYTSTTVPF